ncbi:MAG TPA: hypothetical protein VKP61_03685 [Candidatus Acidoferrum sp.]|nr:hypothetical protein [Candidatus Acidoferrum sp.]
MSPARVFISFSQLLRKFFTSIAAIVTPLFFFASPSLAQTSSHSPGWVVLSLGDYRTLHARAYPPEREPEPPPVDATLTRVDYDLRIDGELASGRASLTVDVLKDGWVRVPIPAGLLVREAKLDGKLVSLAPFAAGKGSNQLCALLSRPGRSVLLLDIALPVASNAGEESISLPSTPSGVTRASVRLPKQGVEIKLTGGLLADKTESATESKWLAYGRGNEPLAFTWKRKTEDHRSSQALRFRGSLTELTGLGEDTTTVVAEVNVEVTQGAAREVRISLPGKVTINQVAGAMVADWEMKDGQLAVTFLEPLEQTAKFIVSGETRSPRDGKIEIPLLRLLNAERDTGGVAVEVLGAGEIKEFKSEGLENADASDLGEVVASRQSTSLTAFRFRAGDAKTPRSLTVNVARYTPQAVLMANIAEARYNVLITNEGKMLVQARYAVRNNQRNFLKITLPPGAMLWSASLAGKPIRPGQSPDGSVLLPLEKSHAGEESPEFAAEVVYISRGTAWNDKGKFNLALPALDLPVSRTGLLVYHPPLFKVTPEPGAFRAEAFEAPASAALNPPVAASGFMDSVSNAPAPPPPPPGADASAITESKVVADQAAAQSLFDNFRMALQGGKAAGILPINVSFPALGPSLFLVSELTGENQAPSTDLNFQREKKAGGR